VCELLHSPGATFYGGKIAEQSVMVVGSYSYHRPLWAFPPHLLERDYDEGRGSVFIFDRQSLERRYKVEANPEV
jgi:hypothetical protein